MGLPDLNNHNNFEDNIALTAQYMDLDTPVEEIVSKVNSLASIPSNFGEKHINGVRVISAISTLIKTKISTQSS